MTDLVSLRPNYAREIRASLTDARKLCAQLGLMHERSSYELQARGVIVRCPWHDERNPSCSVRQGGDGTVAVKCHACDASGDALSLIAAVFKLDIRRNFFDVLRVGADLAGLHALLAELDAGNDPRPIRCVQITMPAKRDEPEYPSVRSLADLVDETIPTSEDGEVSAWLRSRGLDPREVDERGLARALRRQASILPRWCSYKGRSWVETGHRLIVPVRDADGAFSSVRAGRVTEGDTPKRLPPAGCRAAGLIMADSLAVAMLEGRRHPDRVLIVEGEPDYLTHATREHAQATAVIGLVSGGWTRAFAMRVPSGARVVIRTDHDMAGDRYAEEVARSLRGRCVVMRSKEDER